MFGYTKLSDQVEFMYNAPGNSIFLVISNSPEVRYDNDPPPIPVPASSKDPKSIEERKYVPKPYFVIKCARFVRNITCPRCGQRGHAPGDRECPANVKTNDEARKRQEGPLVLFSKLSF